MQKLLLLFGGRSDEHAISCASAKAVAESVCDKWTVIPVGITKSGDFVYCETLPDQEMGYGEVVETGNRVVWPSRSGCKQIEIVTAAGKSFCLEFDLVFPVLHGPFGEDGTLQGMLDTLNLPYVGSGVLASALAMDKHFTKVICSSLGVPTLPWYLVKKTDWQSQKNRVIEQILDRFTPPLFVKPANAGSSFGCTFIEHPEQVTKKFPEELSEQLPKKFHQQLDSRLITHLSGQLSGAVDLALQHGKSAIVEPGLSAPEVFCSVIECNGSLQCSELTLVKHGGDRFYDYRAKYFRPVDFIVPAKLDKTENYAEIASKVFLELGLRHYARIDFFATESGLVLNEVNTCPGLTQRSIFSSSFRGMTYSQVIDAILGQFIS